HHRFLAALAHDAVAVPARLSLYPARRQPAWRRAALPEPDDHDAARRPLAWRRLDLRRLGRAAWRLSLRQSRLEQFWTPNWVPFRTCGEYCRVHPDVFVGRRRLGVLPRRQHGLGGVCPVEDDRPHAHRIRPW